MRLMERERSALSPKYEVFCGDDPSHAFAPGTGKQLYNADKNHIF
jgi:hypothetical protein